jgi:C4-dicarboxylate transporter, DctQ subunit
VKSLAGFLKRFTRIFDKTNGVLAFIAGVILIYIMVTVCIEITVRYFRHPTTWVNEIAGYGLLFMPFLGAAWLLSQEGHVKIELLTDRLRPRSRMFLSIITSSLGTLTCLVMAWYCGQITFQHFINGWTFVSLLKPPAYIILAVIPLGFLLLFIQFVRRTYGFAKTWQTMGRPEKTVHPEKTAEVTGV